MPQPIRADSPCGRGPQSGQFSAQATPYICSMLQVRIPHLEHQCFVEISLVLATQ